MNQTKQRLSKYMASAGVASRRACEELIFAGKVAVNGEVVLLPQTMVDDQDQITLEGEQIGNKQKKLYFILNKPKGYVCSTKGSSRTKLVLELFEGVKERLFTVGRLDKDTEGLLIVTNDGHFANSVIHPSKNIPKEYVAKTNQELTLEHLKAISTGTMVEGTFVKPLKVEKVRKGTLKIIIGEGKKREVRMLLEAAGLSVIELARIRIGQLTLGKLPLGAYKAMTQREMELIFE